MDYKENQDHFSINELREIITRIFDHIENDLGVSNLELTEDFYHDIDIHEVYQNIGEKPETDLGSLYADLDFIRVSLKDPDVYVPSLMFMHVAPLLNYIAAKVGQ